jgi:hypothetical protein
MYEVVLNLSAFETHWAYHGRLQSKRQRYD